MQALYIHISSLIGVFALLNQLIRYAPIDRTILVGVSSALVVYVVLMFTDATVKRILMKSGQAHEARRPASHSKEEKVAERKTAPAA